MEKKERLVDELPEVKQTQPTHRQDKKFQQSRKMSKYSAILILLIGATLIVSGVVIMYLFSYSAERSGNISGGTGFAGMGTEVYADGNLLSDGTYSLTMDITELNAGDNLSIPHTVKSMYHDGTAFINISHEDISNPSSEWFGTSFSAVWDTQDSQNIVVAMIAGTEETYWLTYKADDLWSGASTPLTWSETIEIILAHALGYADGQSVSATGEWIAVYLVTEDPANYSDGYFEITSIDYNGIPEAGNNLVATQEAPNLWKLAEQLQPSTMGQHFFVNYLDANGDPRTLIVQVVS